MTDGPNRVSPRPTQVERVAQPRHVHRQHPRAHATPPVESFAERQHASSVSEGFASVVGPVGIDADRDDGDEEKGGGSTAGTATDPTELDSHTQLDLRLQRIGVTIGTMCKSAQAQTSWHARIPLDPELLAGTVLHVAYSPTMMTVRFETTEWSARDLLSPRLKSLDRILVDMLPSSCQVYVSVA